MIKIILTVILLSAVSFSQLKSINFFSDYSIGSSDAVHPSEGNFSINEVKGFGGGAEVSFSITENFSLKISGGYQGLTVNQDSALAQWNWVFWDTRYRGIVNSNLSDPKYSAAFNPVQEINTLPFFLEAEYNFSLSESFSLAASLGGGVIFYTRSLYLEEIWQKKFDEQNYTFEYSFRNFAQDKKGNPFAAKSGIEIKFQLNEIIQLYSGGSFMYVFRTAGDFGFNEFPLSEAFNIKAGIKFLY